MGLFVKVLGAMVVADAIDRSARRRPRYWYPNQPGLPRTGTRQPYALTTTSARAPAGWYGDPSGQPCWRWWDGHQWTADTHFRRFGLGGYLRCTNHVTPPPPLWIAPATGVAVVIALLLVASGVPEPVICLLLAVGVVAGAVVYRRWDKRHR